MLCSIISAISVNESLLELVIVGCVVVFLGLLLKGIRQPIIIAYIITGILIGPSVFGIVEDRDIINTLGELGLILLLFFIGMEISLPELIKLWKTALFGTVIQIFISIGIVALIGFFAGWGLNQVIILGFVLSLSSSAIVIKLLDEKNEINTTIGKNVVSILLMQDILIVPMLIIIEFISGRPMETYEIAAQISGSILIIGIVLWIIRKGKIRLPYSDKFEKDHELQVLVAILICFGFAVITSLLSLSAALGAFFGGIIVRAADTREWFHNTLHPFRVLFVSMFFVSVGMLIDFNVLAENWLIIVLLVVSALLTNHLINTVILHFFCRKWKNSIYGGALLAQIGELSFIVAATGYLYNGISEYMYQIVILVISITLLLSPFWIMATKQYLFGKESD